MSHEYDAYGPPVRELGKNKRVDLTIDTLNFTIEAADGTALTENTEIVFYTKADPVYTTVNHVNLEGGEIVEALPDAAVYLEIYAASSMVDDMLLFDPDVKFPNKTTQSYKMFRRARQEFVKCLTTRNILRAILGSRGLSAGRRTLADFTIDLSGQANLIGQARSFANDMAEQCRYWLKAVYSCGQRDFEFNDPKSAVKSGLNELEPGGIGRGWAVGGPTLNRRELSRIDPGAGTKTRPRRVYGSRGSF